ncbi:MAG: sigma-70 family RNA polymerase sigma factor [Actinomycetota bacterium]
MSDAFDTLFLAEYQRVVSIAQRVLCSRAEAEDVAQEVFLAYHLKPPAAQDFAPAWLHRAAWHAALNKLRGNRRRQRREADHADGAEQSTDGLAERQVDRQVVREAMGRLPARSAAVLALRYSGLSYAEVAEALGVKAGQIGTMLRRAEVKLRQEVQR